MGKTRRPARDHARRQCRGSAAGRPRRAFALAALGVASVLLATGPARADPSALPLRLAQAGPTDRLRISVAPAISARSASQTALQIRVAPADALPKNCFVRVRGLPPAVSLSEGYATTPGAWAVPLYALASLQMIVPAGVTGRAEISISLVDEDGTLLADTRSVLVVGLQAEATPKEKAEAPVPARPREAILSPADREVAERFVVRGERELEQGQVAVARQFFLRAAQAGLARGALLLAATYDPRELARWRVQGVQPSLDEARKWYERARELGAPEAEERLARLGGG
jgi:TPR repeat protein